jgi:polyphosphate kinase
MPVKAKASRTNLDDPKLFLNRELSLLEFQRRVLQEAQDPNNPLLERVKFLAIVGSNLDEFFMVRVGGLWQQVDAGVVEISPDGLTPAEQLAAIRKLAHTLMSEARACWSKDLQLRLAEAGVHILNYSQLDAGQKARVDEYFDQVVFPVLTPLAFDPGRPFPHISNLSLNLAVLIRDKKKQERFARVKVPNTLPRLVPLKRSSGATRKDGTVPHNHYFVWLEQVIAAHLQTLFPGMQIVEAHPFHVTRDADVVIKELEAADLLASMEQTVRERRFGSVVRVKITASMPEHVRGLLVKELEVDAKDVYVLNDPLGLSDLRALYGAVDRYDLKDAPFVPAVPPQLSGKSINGNLFTAIRQSDILLHHPYDSFLPVIDFLKQAATDPDVLAIKQTLYRVGRNAPVVEALLEAIENGKQVAVLVELKARFDEESNIGWARKLEDEGVHVVYGLLGLKTHSKIALVVRKEGERIRRYVHLATGNYNVVTSQIYTDIGLFTADDDIGADATDLFNYLTGYSAKTRFRKLLVAPINLRERMTELVEREMKLAKGGREARLIFKMNALTDKGMIQQLYRASQAGVKIELICRGMCCLRPGVPGVSDNIRVVSIVGRFLEHSRIYFFNNGGDHEIYIGSADVMTRNIDRRVEVLFPLQDQRLIRQVREDILGAYLGDTVKARELLTTGAYEWVRPRKDQAQFSAQAVLLNHRANGGRT